jgi:hypothetical protein
VTVIRRARIVGAIALISSVVLTLVVVLFTLFALYSAAQDREGGYCESIDHPARCESERLLGLVGLSVTGLGLWGAAAGGGLLLGRWWARRSAITVFSAWTTLVTAAFVATAVDDGGLPVHGVLVWLLIVSLFVTIVVLAAGLPQQRAVPPASLAPPTDPT